MRPKKQNFKALNMNYISETGTVRLQYYCFSSDFNKVKSFFEKNYQEILSFTVTFKLPQPVTPNLNLHS